MVVSFKYFIFRLPLTPIAPWPKVLYTAERVCSLLTDFGVEKEAWLAPGPQPQQTDEDSSPDPNLLFKRSMPLPDCDHSLHHVPGTRIIASDINGN